MTYTQTTSNPQNPEIQTLSSQKILTINILELRTNKQPKNQNKYKSLLNITSLQKVRNRNKKLLAHALKSTKIKL